MDARVEERRSDPRRGVAVRVGLALTATGIASGALDRRALAGILFDWKTAIAFGLFALLLLAAGSARPPRGTTPLAFAAMAVSLTLASFDLGSTPAILGYLALALAATYYAAPHLRPLVVAAFALWTPALWLVAGPALTPLLWVASLAALAFTAVALLDPRRIHPSDRLRRVGYGMLDIAVVGASAARTLVVAGAGAPILDAIAFLVATLVPALAYIRMRGPLREATAVALAFVAFLAVGSAYIMGTSYRNDAVVGPHRAAQLLIAGSDPYATFDLPDALTQFHIDTAFATHLEDGSVVRTYSYPAVSFLVVAPFVALGVGDIRWVYLIAATLIAALAARHLKPAWRPAALATIVGNEIVARQTIISGIDPTWALFIVCAWLARERRWPSAVFLALAIADRQPAWFVFPFVLLAIARRVSVHEAAVRGAIALVCAVLIHVPFLIGAPSRTLEGVLTPIFAPIVADGVGLVQFGIRDLYTPILPRAAYTALALAAFAGLLALFWRRPRALAGAALGWALLPLYLAWRSLQNYFAFSPLFALVADDELAEDVSTRSTAAQPDPRRAPQRAS